MKNRGSSSTSSPALASGPLPGSRAFSLADTALLVGNAPSVIERWAKELDWSSFGHVLSVNRALLWLEQGLIPRMDHWICVDGRKPYGRDRYGVSQREYGEAFDRAWKDKARSFKVISNEIPADVFLIGPGHDRWGEGHYEEPYPPDGSINRKLRLHSPASTVLIAADYALHYLGAKALVFAGVEYDCKSLPAAMKLSMEKLLDYCERVHVDVYTTAPDSVLWSYLRDMGKGFQTWQ